ncbi:YhcN/YlaJ family sporulation lipoprotein [Paenibacillus eucommiae]|uniref:YhcN/YlaJ family sporulation lipoprotein n=1 Tax=Paenibacillus eucommiae TaxID=1355755 RepID=A0ABS4J116_9BACL|nr:YhcN/YlaJ family sporulation lipoprotein [Paenibacillus eucommiae]MBP1993532.1 YhcN/YlaJ family sporulation lipoprotein [Paenibacillus eucommiae]
MNKSKGLSVKILLLGSCLTLSLAGCSANRTQDMRQHSMNSPMSTVRPNTAINNVEEKYVVADQAANELAKMPEISQANVLVMGNTAYAAVGLKPNQTYTSALETKIAAQVKAVDPTINNVFVSTNPDFISRVNNYANEVRNGRPVSGLVNELGEVVRRLFPNVK